MDVSRTFLVHMDLCPSGPTFTSVTFSIFWVGSKEKDRVVEVKFHQHDILKWVIFNALQCPAVLT